MFVTATVNGDGGEMRKITLHHVLGFTFFLFLFPLPGDEDFFSVALEVVYI